MLTGFPKVVVEATSIEVDVRERRKSTIEKLLLDFVGDITTFLEHCSRPLSKPNIVVNLEVLEASGRRILTADTLL